MDEFRVCAKGFGKTKLANDYFKWTKCTPKKKEETENLNLS